MALSLVFEPRFEPRFFGPLAGHGKVPFYFGGAGRPRVGAPQADWYHCPDPVPNWPRRGKSPYELPSGGVKHGSELRQSSGTGRGRPGAERGTPWGRARKTWGRRGTPGAGPAGRPRPPGQHAPPNVNGVCRIMSSVTTNVWSNTLPAMSNSKTKLTPLAKNMRA
jgi:hypothetical protein